MFRINLYKTLCKKYDIKGKQHSLSTNYCVGKTTLYWALKKNHTGFLVF